MADSARYSLEEHEKKSGRRGRKAVNAVFAVVAVLLVAVVAWQGWEAIRPPDISAYASETIQLVGLGNEVREVSPEQLAQMDCQSVKASNSSDRAGQGTVVEKTAYGYGPKLDDVVAQWGYELADFDRVVVTCLDGYEIVILPGDTLEGDVYLSIARGKDALPEDMRPMRLIMPAMPPGQWAYGIESITFESLGA